MPACLQPPELSCPSTLDWVCPGAGVGLAWCCDPPCTQEPPSAQ